MLSNMRFNYFNKKYISILSLSLMGFFSLYVGFGMYAENIETAENIENTSKNLISKSVDIEEILDYTFYRHTVEMYGLSEIFRVHFTEYDAEQFSIDPKSDLRDGGKLEFADKFGDQYQQLTPFPNTVVIFPLFTAAAYNEPGFYTFFRDECDETCIIDVSFDSPPVEFTSSRMATQILYDLGYEFITDVDVDKNPDILKNYETIILLHNEYVTKKMFNAISAHPNIIYLYPNALYAEITVNYDDNTMTLIRGHNYPEFEIRNGFDYSIEERFHDYEYDTNCFNWEFIKFENGYALNCYPDHVIFAELNMIKALRDISSQYHDDL